MFEVKIIIIHLPFFKYLDNILYFPIIPLFSFLLFWRKKTERGIINNLFNIVLKIKELNVF